MNALHERRRICGARYPLTMWIAVCSVGAMMVVGSGSAKGQYAPGAGAPSRSTFDFPLTYEPDVRRDIWRLDFWRAWWPFTARHIVVVRRDLGNLSLDVSPNVGFVS